MPFSQFCIIIERDNRELYREIVPNKRLVLKKDYCSFIFCYVYLKYILISREFLIFDIIFPPKDLCQTLFLVRW